MSRKRSGTKSNGTNNGNGLFGNNGNSISLNIKGRGDDPLEVEENRNGLLYDIYKCNKCGKYAWIYMLYKRDIKCPNCKGLLVRLPPLEESLSKYREQIKHQRKQVVGEVHDCVSGLDEQRSFFGGFAVEASS